MVGETSPGAYPSSCTMGNDTFPGANRPGRGADHPPPSKWRGHERIGLYLYSPSGTQWRVMGRTLPYVIGTETVKLVITNSLTLNE